MRFHSRSLLIPLVLLALLFLAACAINITVIAGAAGKFYRDPAKAPRKPVAVILGAGLLPGGRPSLMFKDRILTGYELFRLGRVDKLLLTGDGRREDYNEVRAMSRLLLARGVPENALIRDPYGLSTYESLRRASDTFGVREALLVTQGFHLPRALLLAKRLGLDTAGVRAYRRGYPYFGFASRVREFCARVKDRAISRPG